MACLNKEESKECKVKLSIQIGIEDKIKGRKQNGILLMKCQIP